MGGFYRPDDIGPVRVVAFSGRSPTSSSRSDGTNCALSVS